MLSRLTHLTESSVTASDGAIGHVQSAFFDDQDWTIRYLVVDTGDWLAGRLVLISPYAVRQPLSSDKNIDLALTREQVKNSPDVDTHQPVSRQHEREVLGYYAFPEYWDGGGLWAMGASPMLPPALPPAEQEAINRRMKERDIRAGDVHLRSSVLITGYDIQASDGSIGHVKDFIFDDESWAIRYLLVDTRNWWPGGQKVLIARHWIDGIDWGTQTVSVNMTREQVKASPAYDDASPMSRDDEHRLHAAYGRRGYWD